MDSLMSLVSGVYNLFIAPPNQPAQFNPTTQVPASNESAQNNFANQALISAVLNRDIEGVKAALVKGAQVDSMDDNSRTALMIAAGNGHRVITRILLAQGADHALEDKDGFTALELAIYFGKTEIAQILLDSGALFDSAMLNNLLTMDEAYKAANTIFTLSLHQRCTLDLDTALETAFNNEDIKLIVLLRQNGANPSTIQLPEDTLRVAAKKGQLKSVQALLAIGFPVNNQEHNYGNTAIIWAIKQGHLNIAKLLLDKGADITLSNNQGENPFLLCVPKSLHNTKFLSFCHHLLNGMTLEQIKTLEQDPYCAGIITPYMKKTMADLQEKTISLLGGSFFYDNEAETGLFIPLEIRMHMLSLMSYPKWCMPFMTHTQNTILEIFKERNKKAPAMIFSSVYQPDAIEIDAEEKSAPKKRDRSVLL